SSFINDAEEFLYAMLKKDRCIKMNNLPYCIWVRQVQGRRLEEALFKRRARKGDKYDVIAPAREAELLVDLANKQVLVHIRHCHRLDDNGKSNGYVLDKTYAVELPPTFGVPSELKPRGMSFPDLLERRANVLDMLAEQATEIALTTARINLGNTPLDLPLHLKN